MKKQYPDPDLGFSDHREWARHRTTRVPYFGPETSDDYYSTNSPFTEDLGRSTTQWYFDQYFGTSNARPEDAPPNHSIHYETVFGPRDDEPVTDDDLSPEEAARQMIIAAMDPHELRTFDAFDPLHVSGFISNVHQSRAGDPPLTDWNIHLALRRAVSNTMNPDPVLAEQAKISNFLIKGHRADAKYPF